jgi:hypothetical protein
MTKKYEGTWSANNGSTYSYGYFGNNKRALAKEMRSIAKGNVFASQTKEKMNSGNWAVYEVVDGEREMDPVVSGTVRN